MPLPRGTLLDNRTLGILELPAVLERLARLTVSPAGRERALSLRPAIERNEVVQRQRQVAEAAWLHQSSVSLPFEGVKDVRHLAHAAARGRTLTTRELREVADTARCGELIRRTLTQVRDHTPLLSTMGTKIPELDPLRRLIDSAVNTRGEVTDGASVDLAAIRTELVQAHDTLLARIQSIAASPNLRSALSDSIVTQRAGRYVVPVRCP